MAQKANPILVSRPSGDLKSLREQVVGPVKVYLESGRHSEEDDTLMMEEYEDKDGEIKQRPELETEPFLKDVWVRKVYATKKNAEIEAKIRAEEAGKSDEDSLLGMRIAVSTVVALVAKWDLTEDGVPVPLTQEGLEAADVPVEFLYRIASACYDYRRIPKDLSGRLPSTSLQAE